MNPSRKNLLEKVNEEEKAAVRNGAEIGGYAPALQGLEFTDMKELTPTIVNKLIRRIEVHNPEKKHARKAVKVDIYFTAVGLGVYRTSRKSENDGTDAKHITDMPKQLTA